MHTKHITLEACEVEGKIRMRVRDKTEKKKSRKTKENKRGSLHEITNIS